MTLKLVVVRMSNADDKKTVIVGLQARAFVAPETELPPVAANHKHARPKRHVIPLASTSVARDSNSFRCGKLSCRGSSLITHW